MATIPTPAIPALLKKLTPIFQVEAIEPSLPFWVDRLGFVKTVEVPHGSGLGFVALERDGIEIMMQTHASIAEDLGQPAQKGGRASIYLEVPSLAAIETALTGVKQVVRRKAPYGSEELFVHDPAGNLIGFAQPAAR